MREEKKRFQPLDLVPIGIIAIVIVGIFLAANVNIIAAVPGVVGILLRPSYVKGFGIMWLQVIVGSLVGGGVGVAIGALIFRSRWLTRSAIPFLRYAQWLPVFAYWAFLSPRWIVTPRWLLMVVWGAQAVFPAAMLAACYHYLSFRTALEPKWMRHVTRAVLFRAFLVCFWWQMFFKPEEWDWYVLIEGSPHDQYKVLALIVLLMISVWIVNLLTDASFEESAAARGLAIAREIEEKSGKIRYGTFLIVIAILLVWQVFNAQLFGLFLIPPPLVVLATAYHLSAGDGSIWSDMQISLLEILGGLVLAALPAFLIMWALAFQGAFKRSRGLLLTLMNLTPIGLWLLLFPSLDIGFWHKVILIASLSLFPVFQALWTLSHYSLPSRIFLALDEALPYAFAGMFFGESFAATEGLGFSIVVLTASGRMSGAMAVCLIVMILLVGISVALRALAKRLQFINRHHPALRPVPPDLND